MKAFQKIIKEKKEGTAFSDELIKESVCKEIPKEEAKKVILEYEWLGNFGLSRYCYGMYIHEVLIAVVCFGATGARKDKYSNYVGEQFSNSGIQLVRGASTVLAPKHASSKLIAYSLNEIKKKGYKFVVAFSDPMAGEVGTVYQATNWIYTGGSTDSKGKERKHYNMIIDGKKHHLRTVVTKFGTSKRSILEARGHKIEYEYLQAKGRYFYLLGSKKENKQMLQNLSKFIKAYPKREE